MRTDNRTGFKIQEKIGKYGTYKNPLTKLKKIKLQLIHYKIT